MLDLCPCHPATRIHPQTGEWLPGSFEGLLAELDSLAANAAAHESLLLYRGHADRRWRLDSTFVRSIKSQLLKMDPVDGFAEHLHYSGDLSTTFTSLLLLKFGGLMGPSEELYRAASEHAIDPWFELMKRCQQYPDEDMPQLRGTNLIDWSRDPSVALYFANEDRTNEGAIFVCDATSMGKTHQDTPVADILSMLRTQMIDGCANGMPLLFSPRRQIAYARAKNQQAVYFAQMEMRLDLIEQWSLLEAAQPGLSILVKLVLPAGSVAACQAYLSSRHVTREFIYPNEVVTVSARSET
jgi:hypothetical protein